MADTIHDTRAIPRGSFTPEEFAARHALPYTTVTRWCQEGRLRAIQVGNTHNFRIPLSEDERFLAGEVA